MKPENYKVIARIIKKYNVDENQQEYVALALASYFNREDCKATVRKGIVIPSFRKFNRKQFLKDCGVAK